MVTGTLHTGWGGRRERHRPLRGMFRLALGLWLICMAPVMAWAQAAESTANAIQGVDVSTLPGDRVQIRFSLAQPATQPLTFTIDNPARIAFDFPNTQNKLASRTTEIGIGPARNLSAVEAKGRTRVVLNLLQLVPYETRVEGNNVYVVLGAGGATAVAAAPAPAPAVGRAAKVPSHTIRSIDFRRGDKGEGRILIQLSDAGASVNVRDLGGKLLLDFADTTLPVELQQRLDVVDFATPVTTIDTVSQGSAVRMTVSAQGNYEHMAYQSENQLTIEVKKAVKKEQTITTGQPAYTGERLSLNFQNIDTRAVLQLIADFTNMNLVASDTIKGNVTVRLQNVPWDQALDIILKTKGLAMRKMGNVMFIAPSEEIAAREKLELESQKQIVELEPLRSELIQINYAKAADIATLLKADKNSMLSPRGTVSIDARTNTLMVQDTSDRLNDVRKLVATLDVPIKQVLIESRIVIANETFGKELGVRFGVTRDSSADATSGRAGIFTGSLTGVKQLVNNETLVIEDNLNVDLPLSNPAGSFAIALAKLPFGTLLDLELQAMQAEGKGEVVSTPRVITANQKEAFIEQGVEIPYQQASSSGATSVSFKKAVLSLKVTPQITPDDRVVMDLQVNKDSVGQVYLGVPSINTREINTQVLVQNGETIVLGGVYEQSSNDNVRRVPFFSDLPLVGSLFRSKIKSNTKEELLIFITPKIIKEGVSLN